MMSYREILQYGEDFLKKEAISEYKNDAFILLEYVFNITRTWYFIHKEEKADIKNIENYKKCLKRRSEKIPVQYITGIQEFMGYSFHVDERVLIPRQDTEVVVETAINLLKDYRNPDILDMCTGSGCIAISMNKLIHDSKVVAADISSGALEVAKKNNINLNADVSFVESDLFSNLDNNMKFHMIISNPPYIPTKDIEALMPEVKLHEPNLALDGKDDGLIFYKKICNKASEYIIPQGILIFEIGYDQGNDVAAIMDNNGFNHIKIKKDLAGLDRIVYGIRC